MSGPPPFKAIAKAVVASATDVYTPPQPEVPLNSFYLPRTPAMVSIGLAVSMVAVIANGSDAYLQRQFPNQVFELRKLILSPLGMKMMKGLAIVHLAEGAYTLLTCIHRGWYSPLNTMKWTLSSTLFGIGSLIQLKKHARDVAGLK